MASCKKNTGMLLPTMSENPSDQPMMIKHLRFVRVRGKKQITMDGGRVGSRGAAER